MVLVDTQVSSQLSQNCDLYNNEEIKEDVYPFTSFYKEALPIFEEMIKSCSDRASFNESLEVMRTQKIKIYLKNEKLKKSKQIQ